MRAASALTRDLRLAIQSLGRAPGFTLIAVLTLGLGIGANTAMFSLLSGYVLRPVPYPAADRLERIYRATQGDPHGSFSGADYRELEAAMGAYGQVAAYGNAAMSLSAPGEPAEMVQGLRASPNLFATLGAGPALGRGFRPEEGIHGNHRVLVISHRYWRNRFGGDPGVVGRAVRVDGEPYTIVGVLPEDFSDWRHLSFIDLYRPLALDEREMRDRTATWLRVVGRRAPDVSPAQGERVVAALGERLAAEHPVANAGSRWRTVGLRQSFLDGQGRAMISMLVGLSGFVLLIACSNLANLLLARTVARAREFGVRAALGASPLQVLRPLVVEALVLAAAGGACAFVVATWTFDWLAKRSAGESGVGVELQFDWPVLAWAFGACLLTAVAFGVAPALFVLRLDVNATLKSGARGTTGGRGHQRFRHALVIGQFALATVLLGGAALFVRGLHDLNNRREGWESDRVVIGTTQLPAATYGGEAEIAAFQRRALDALRALPGVESASVSYALPYFGMAEPRRYAVEGRPPPPPGREPAARVNGVSPAYFGTVGTRIVAGRAFTDDDGPNAPRVFVINQAMARALFPGESPLGRRIAGVDGGGAVAWGQVVGVAADVASVYGDHDPVAFQLYQPMAQEPRRMMEIAVRARGVEPAALVAGIRGAVMALDPDLPVRGLQPAPASIARANYQLGVLGSVLTGLAALGLGLAALGIYGVITRTMAQRRGEFGIRLALGARAGDITRLVLTSGTRLAVAGSAVGLLGAWAVTRLIMASFPAMPAAGGTALAAATALLVTVALVASYLPARAASRIAPAESLQSQ